MVVAPRGYNVNVRTCTPVNQVSVNMPSVTPEPVHPPPTAPRPRNPRGAGQQLRGDLIDAAVQLISDTGNPEAVSIRAVAKAAGVTPTAAYRHVADRDDLVEAACRHLFELFTALMLEATTDAGDPFQRLELAGRAYLRFAEENQGLYRSLFSNPLHLDDDFTDETAVGVTSFGLLVAMVQDCIDAGAPVEMSGDPTAATYLSFQLWTWLHGLVDLRITHPALPWPDPFRMLTDMRITLRLVPPPG
jgi:AcrR family transcriptional regulator